MPSAVTAPAFNGFDETLVAGDARVRALETFAATHSGREKPSRYWKHDIEALSVDGLTIDPDAGSVHIDATSPRVIACDLHTAAREHGELFRRAFATALEPSQKFAQLAYAFANVGAFIYVPADCSVDTPIAVTYRIGAQQALFPYTLVLLERGARATIVERIEAGAGAFVAGIAEVIGGDTSQLTYAAVQDAPSDARTAFTRVARPGRDASISWATAELGSSLAISDVIVTMSAPGIESKIATLFFPTGSQHVDLMTTVDHRVGDCTSETVVKTAANDAGQGRYLGNIRIEKDAQRSDANLRDDAFLLSKRAHIDSIPALEIAANDVKAAHGATIGALDDEQLFYMTSRGIERRAAEQMIALGFFEPVIDAFPTEALREELRTVLQQKVVG